MSEALILLPAGESFRGVLIAAAIAVAVGCLAWFLRHRWAKRRSPKIRDHAEWDNPSPGVWVRTDPEAREFFDRLT